MKKDPLEDSLRFHRFSSMNGESGWQKGHVMKKVTPFLIFGHCQLLGPPLPSLHLGNPLKTCGCSMLLLAAKNLNQCSLSLWPSAYPSPASPPSHHQSPKLHPHPSPPGHLLIKPRVSFPFLGIPAYCEYYIHFIHIHWWVCCVISLDIQRNSWVGDYAHLPGDWLKQGSWTNWPESGISHRTPAEHRWLPLPTLDTAIASGINLQSDPESLCHVPYVQNSGWENSIVWT